MSTGTIPARLFPCKLIKAHSQTKEGTGTGSSRSFHRNSCTYPGVPLRIRLLRPSASSRARVVAQTKHVPTVYFEVLARARRNILHMYTVWANPKQSTSGFHLRMPHCEPHAEGAAAPSPHPRMGTCACAPAPTPGGGAHRPAPALGNCTSPGAWARTHPLFHGSARIRRPMRAPASVPHPRAHTSAVSPECVEH